MFMGRKNPRVAFLSLAFGLGFCGLGSGMDDMTVVAEDDAQCPIAETVIPIWRHRITIKHCTGDACEKLGGGQDKCKRSTVMSDPDKNGKRHKTNQWNCRC